MDLKLRTPALKTFSIDMCSVPNRTEAVLTWAKSWLLLIVQDSRDEKEDQPWRLCAPVSRGGLLVCRWSSHCIPLLCPRRQVGLLAAGQGSWLGNGYLRATGKVSHLGSHTARSAACRKSTDKRERHVGEWLSFHALYIKTSEVRKNQNNVQVALFC